MDDEIGVDTAAVPGNLYLQLVVENGVPSSPVLGAPFATPMVSASVFNDSQPLFQSFSASVVHLMLCRERRSYGLEVSSASFS